MAFSVKSGQIKNFEIGFLGGNKAQKIVSFGHDVKKESKIMLSMESLRKFLRF